MYQYVPAADPDPLGQAPLAGGAFLRMFLAESQRSDCVSDVGQEMSDWRRPSSRRGMDRFLALGLLKEKGLVRSGVD